VSSALTHALRHVVVHLPTLADRRVDIPLLAEAFVANSGDVVPLRFESDALGVLEEYSWPGNVAELRAVVERARLIATNGRIRAADIAVGAGSSALELCEVERRHIVAVLHANAWHQGKSAQSLGISPKTLYRKMREFSLRRPSSEKPM
jgi:two-component system NtrC family response regulator